MEAALDRLAQVYLRFAANEAKDRSPLYEELAFGVAEDDRLLRLLAGLPPPKQQPNLLFGAVRYLCGTAEDWGQFRSWVLERWEEILSIIRTRRTQTNEPARCATLLPILATLPQPLALLEVGAAAGLCLLPDYYAYRFNAHHVAPARSASTEPPTFTCQADLATPLPERNIEVAWRAGLDLEPIDLHDQDRVRWLEALVWPGEGRRLELLRAAIEVARTGPPRVLRGDLRSDLPELAAQAPSAATLVVFHTAVLAYVPDPDDRRAFAETVRELGAVWIANEAPGLQAGCARPGHPWPAGFDPFLLTRDQRPTAWTDPHGASIEWIG